jgi:hypothetical protein
MWWQEILIGVIVGVVILVIEYHTNWFAKRSSLPSLRPTVEKLINKFGQRIPGWVIFWKGYLAFVIPFLVVFINLMLLYSEVRIYSGIMSTLIVSLVISGILAILVFDLPMNVVTSFLIICNIVIVITFLGFPKFSALSWPTFTFSTTGTPETTHSIPDMSNIDTVVLFVTLMVFSATWITANIIVSSIQKDREALEERLDLLYETAGISEMLASRERELLDCVVTKWDEFLIELEKSNKMAGQQARHCVPVEFNQYTLRLGCKFDEDVKNIVSPRGTPKYPIPAVLATTQEAMQKFFNKPRLKLSCEKIEEDKYEAILLKLKNYNSSDETSSQTNRKGRRTR